MTSITPQASAPARSARNALLLFVVVLGFFCISGACGLLYQVVWTRKLALLLGSASYAVSTVLSIFFLGLGVGSLWGGRLADRSRRPLFIFAIFEILIGIWALLFIWMIHGGEAFVVDLLRPWVASRMGGVAVRATLALAFLIVPVTLMGATLPLLARFVAHDSRARTLRIGTLYSVNTFGAVAGCVLTGFYLIEWLGYTWTTCTGASANILVGFAALAVSRPIGMASAQTNTPDETLSGISHRAAWSAAAAFALSGFCALALEVLWTRLLVVVFMGTTYAFTTMLATLLLGIAAGSMVVSPVLERVRHPISFFGGILAATGLACLAMLPVFAHLPDWYAAWRASAGAEWHGVVRAKFWLSFAALFPPTFLFGATFPCVVRAVAAGSPQLGRRVGRLYALNTFGGVLGALAGGYVLLPVIGVHRSIMVLSALLFMGGLWLIVVCPTRRRLPKLVGANILAFALFILWFFIPLDVGTALNRGFLPKDHHVIHYDEGVEGTVVVSEPDDAAGGRDRVLWINAVQATTTIEKGVKMNRFQGVLPMFFDREPETALFMCFGSGITAGTLGQFDFDRIDAVEIASDVLDAAPMFAADNFNVTENGKINFIIDDGRNFLLTTTHAYDLITFEPMPLAIAGVANFYTVEFYEQCLAHLTPGGIVSQWIPLHSLNPDLVQSLTYTFTRVFPEYAVFFVNADLFIIGSREPLHIDYGQLEARLAAKPDVVRALHDVGFPDLEELVSTFFMDKTATDAYVQGGRLMTDDRPWAEFLAPRLMFESTVKDSLADLIPHYQSPTQMLVQEPPAPASVVQALNRRAEARRQDLAGLKKYYAGAFGNRGEKEFVAALEIDDKDATAKYYLRQIAQNDVPLLINWGEHDKAFAFLEPLLEHAGDVALFHKLAGDTHYDAKQYDAALAAYEAYAARGGDDPKTLQRLEEIRTEKITDAAAG